MRWGFDYGLSSTVLSLSSFEFNENLNSADVIGVAYGLAFSTDLEIEVPTISLVARDEKSLRLAFEEFSQWAEYSDGDAIDLTIIFMKNGAYKLCVGPEHRALLKRTLQYDAVLSPIAMQISWVKHIDTTSQPLKELRAFLENGLRPVMFTAATYKGLALPGTTPVSDLLHTVNHNNELIKFNIRFIDEGSDVDNQWQEIILGSGKKKQRPKPRKAPPPPAELIWNERVNRIKTLFPVTLWRSKITEPLLVVRQTVEQAGLLPWQIDQALCNIIISREIGSGIVHFEGIDKKDWPGTLIEKLQSRFEISDGTWDGAHQITSDMLIQQAKLDAQVLLKAYGVTRIENSIKSTQYQLQKAGLLTPPAI